MDQRNNPVWTMRMYFFWRRHDISIGYRYKGLCSVPCVPADPARACKNILHSAGISREHYAIGNTKVSDDCVIITLVRLSVNDMLFSV